MIKVFDAFDLDIKSVQSETLRRLVPTKNFSVDFKTYEIDHIKKTTPSANMVSGQHIGRGASSVSGDTGPHSSRWTFTDGDRNGVYLFGSKISPSHERRFW